jgi:hypothetical protein
MMRQIEDLRRGVDIAVATPGRLTDLINRNEMSLEETKLVVIDEADRMADMGFTPQVTWLLDGVAKERQILLFSATLDGDVEHLVKKYMNDPVTHAISNEDDDEAIMRRATHLAVGTATPTKFQDLAYLCDASQRTILFVKNRFATERAADALTDLGVSALAMHGGMTQAARSKALARWASGGVRALVATDVAARGVHVDAVDLVVHVDPPQEHKDYLHRSGRTARAGATGVVVSMLRKEQRKGAAVMFKRLGVEVADAGADEARDLIRAVRLAPKQVGHDVVDVRGAGLSEEANLDAALFDGVDGPPVAAKPRTAKVDEWAGTEERYAEETADPSVDTWGTRGNSGGNSYRDGGRPSGDRHGGGDRGARGFERGGFGGRDSRPASGPRGASSGSLFGSSSGGSDRFGAAKSFGDRSGSRDRYVAADSSTDRGAGRPSWGADRSAGAGAGRPTGDRPSWGADRAARPSSDRPSSDRPSFDRDRPRSNSFERGAGNGAGAGRSDRGGGKAYGDRSYSPGGAGRDGVSRDHNRDRPWTPGGDTRSERPARAWTNDRPSVDRGSSDRPTRSWSNDRPTSDRGSFDRGSSERPARPAGERQAFGRGPASDRGNTWGAPRAERSDRPAWGDRDRGDRPAGNDRAGGYRGSGSGSGRPSTGRSEWAPRGAAAGGAARSFDRDRPAREDRPARDGAPAAREGGARWSNGAPGARSWSNDRPGARSDSRGPSAGRPAYGSGAGKAGGRPGARGASSGAGFQGSPKLTWRASRPK